MDRSSRPMWRTVLSGVMGAGLALCAALPACAAAVEPPQSLRDALFGNRSAAGGMEPPPPVARYRLDIGASFVVDRIGRDQILLKFDGGDEVWALKGVGAAHGDMVFKNDVGEPVLRATRWGGMTLFTPSLPEGSPASLAGEALAIHGRAQIGVQALSAIMMQSSARARQVVGHAVAFNARDVPAAFDWLFADAAQLAADAFVRAAQDGRRALLARFSEVDLAAGRAPDVVVVGPAVRITVAPERGVAGRPSSRRIQAVVARR